MEKKSIKLLLQPNAEREDSRQPEFVGPGNAELGLGDYSSGCYLSSGDYGPYLSLRFYLQKEFEGPKQPKQVKVSVSQNKNCNPDCDDPHYRGKAEILDAKYKIKAWIRQNPTTSLLYVEVVFEEADQIEPGELSPSAQAAQQAAFDFLTGMGASVKPLPIEWQKQSAPTVERRSQAKARSPDLDSGPEDEPDSIPFKATIYREVRNHRRRC